MKKTIQAIFVLALSVFVLAGCNQGMTTSEKQEATRDALMTRANNNTPIPEIRNFLAREAVAEYMRRMDQANKLFYIYILADNGQFVGYHVARTQTVNICTFMAPTDKIEKTRGHYWKRAAPANDGLYYGAGACNVDYFFDSATDALLQLKGLNYIISDMPLALDVKPLKVQQVK